MTQDILLAVDYHDQNCVVRRFDTKTAAEQVFTVPTTADDLNRVISRARADAGPRGRVVWIQESTTGWARLQALAGDRVVFCLGTV
jgi:hypothetical protein